MKFLDFYNCLREKTHLRYKDSNLMSTTITTNIRNLIEFILLICHLNLFLLLNTISSKVRFSVFCLRSLTEVRNAYQQRWHMPERFVALLKLN